MLTMMWYDVNVAQDVVCRPLCGMMLLRIMCVVGVMMSMLLRMLSVDHDVV